MLQFPFPALAPPEEISSADWAEKYRVLSSRVASEPGPMSLDRTPYVRGILDTLDQPHVRQVWVMKCVQSGLSETSRSYLGAHIDLRPADAMIVFPNEASARDMLDERIRPMLEDTPQLARYLSGRGHDNKTGKINLSSMMVVIGFSGSPTALSSRPISMLVLDEVDKFPNYRGVETGSIALAIARTTTHRNSKVFGLSTPTIPTGNIARRFEQAGLRKHYHAKCQGCGEGMRPDFDLVTFAGKKSEDEDELRQVKADLESGRTVATLACSDCKHEHDDAAYRQAVREGDWVGEGFADSQIVAFHVHGLTSPWLGVQKLATAYVTAKLSGLEELQNFNNNSLGVPFWDESIHGSATTTIGQATLYRLAERGYQRGVCPSWTTAILAGVDSGRTEHQYVVRAFGPGYRSRLLDYGECLTSELHDRVMRTWRVEDSPRSIPTRRMCIDIGGTRSRRDMSRTDELYRYCREDPAHRFAVKGYGGGGEPSQPIVTRTHIYHPMSVGQRPYEVTLNTLDVGYFKDVLAGKINSETEWELFAGVGRDYIQQVCAERKVLVERRIRQGVARDVWRWVPRTSGAANHFLDAEVYVLACAFLLDLDMIRHTPAEIDGAPQRYKAAKDHEPWQIGR